MPSTVSAPAAPSQELSSDNLNYLRRFGFRPTSMQEIDDLGRNLATALVIRMQNTLHKNPPLLELSVQEATDGREKIEALLNQGSGVYGEGMDNTRNYTLDAIQASVCHYLGCSDPDKIAQVDVCEAIMTDKHGEDILMDDDSPVTGIQVTAPTEIVKEASTAFRRKALDRVRAWRRPAA